jgi:hypothetical protein
MVGISVLLFGFHRKIPLRIKLPLVFLSFLSWFNHNSFYESAAIEQTVAFNAGILLTAQLISQSDKLKPNVIYLFLRLMAAIESIFFILNDFGINPYNPHQTLYKMYPVGSLGQQTLSGALLAVAAPACLTKKSWPLLIPIAYAMYLSGSAMTWCACVFGCSYVIFRPKLKTLVILGAALVSFSYLGLGAFQFFSPHGRFAVWRWCVHEYCSMWNLRDILFGRGLGWLYNHLNVFMEDLKFTYAHNEFIELFWAVGLVGAFLFFLLVLPLRHIKPDKHLYVMLGILISVAANSVGNFTLHVSSIAQIAIMAYAFIIGRIHFEEG